jgi:DNA-binding MarR family transcriptional regulator
MLSTTRRALSAILDTDISITPEQKKIIMAVADRPLIERELPQAIPRIIRREEAAKYLGVSVKRVDQLSRSGFLKRIQIPGTSRAIGITEASIRALTDPK